MWLIRCERTFAGQLHISYIFAHVYADKIKFYITAYLEEASI